jgi:hypothetical protein
LLLAELKTGDDTQINKALTKLLGIIDKEKRLREQHAANKGIVTSLRDHWKETLPESDLKQLRKQNEETVVRLLTEIETAAIVFLAANRDGCSDETATALIVGPSVYGHMIYALAALALDWANVGSLRTTNPTTPFLVVFLLSFLTTESLNLS